MELWERSCGGEREKASSRIEVSSEGYNIGHETLSTLKRVSGFKRIFFGDDILGLDEGYRDWASVFKILANKGNEAMTELLYSFSYEFFRGRADRMNSKFATADTSAEQHAKNVDNWILKQLDGGNVVGVAFAGHFSVIIGYRDGGGFLFLGSYGETGEWCAEGGLHELVDALRVVIAHDVPFGRHGRCLG